MPRPAPTRSAARWSSSTPGAAATRRRHARRIDAAPRRRRPQRSSTSGSSPRPGPAVRLLRSPPTSWVAPTSARIAVGAAADLVWWYDEPGRPRRLARGPPVHRSDTAWFELAPARMTGRERPRGHRHRDRCREDRGHRGDRRAGLGRGSSVAVVKPGQTGVTSDEPGDLDEVRRLVTAGDPAAGAALDLLELSRFADPLAPAAAARDAGRPPYDLRDAVEVVRALADRHRLVLVEGAGGLLVRYDDEGTTIGDLARWLGRAVRRRHPRDAGHAEPHRADPRGDGPPWPGSRRSRHRCVARGARPRRPVQRPRPRDPRRPTAVRIAARARRAPSGARDFAAAAHRDWGPSSAAPSMRQTSGDGPSRRPT